MIAAAFTLLLSFILCGLYLLLARRLQILDRPNARSSHQRPTPHGGGVPLYLAFGLGVLYAGATLGSWPVAYVALLLAATLLMVLGVLDDLRGLSVRLRFALYALCCLGLSAALLQELSFGGLWWLAVWLFVSLGMLWSLNLYNFMDGIDGIAASQCILACGGASLLTWQSGGAGQYILFCLLLAASHAGFLLWNWPPARLFMGDAGSIPSGLLLAGLALLGAVQGHLNPLCWLVLLALFITDASWTLIWRMLSGQPFTQPHRLHAYQRLSRHWNSHRAVDVLLLLCHVFWLFPLAWAVQTWPVHAFYLVILAYLPLCLGMAKIGRFA